MLDASGPATGTPVAGADFMIGASDYGSANFLSASLDEMAYYARALTVQEIAAHVTARGPLTPPASGLLEYP